MQRFYGYILLLLVAVCTSCEMRLKPFSEDGAGEGSALLRYDRVESRFLTTGDFSALQQMNTHYAQPTRLLIEDLLQLGTVDDPETRSRLLAFYQDTLLQTVIEDTEAIYAETEDIAAELDKAFKRMERLLPDMPKPTVYTQIGAMRQSIIVSDSLIGISLEKYLGSDYPLYHNYFDENQRQSMTREYIVPDCLVFYLVSRYSLADFEHRSAEEREQHIGRIMHVANLMMGNRFFQTLNVEVAEKALKNSNVSLKDFLEMDKEGGE